MKNDIVDYFADSCVSKLSFIGLRTIKEVEDLLQLNQKIILAFADSWIKKDYTGNFFSGISIFYLCYIMLLEKNNKDILIQYCKKELDFHATDEKANKFAEDILKKYKSIRIS